MREIAPAAMPITPNAITSPWPMKMPRATMMMKKAIQMSCQKWPDRIERFISVCLTVSSGPAYFSWSLCRRYLLMGTGASARISSSTCSAVAPLSRAVELRIIRWDSTDGASCFMSSGITKSRPSTAARAWAVL